MSEWYVFEAWRAPEGYPWVVIDHFNLKALLPYPPHVIVVGLHGRGVSKVVILKPGTMDLFGL